MSRLSLRCIMFRHFATAGRKCLLLLALALAISTSMQAQKLQPNVITCDISQSPVTFYYGDYVTFTLNGTCQNTATNWTTNCGTIQSSDANSVLILISQSCSSITVSAYNGSTLLKSKAFAVTAAPALGYGSISNAAQTINYGTVPTPLTTSAASGGRCTAGYSYTWFMSTDNVNWTSAGGGQNFQPGALTTTTYFRRLVMCGNQSGYTNTATVTVYPDVNAGTISPALQTINYSTSPAQVSVSGVSGGNGTYTYQWQNSTDNSNWGNIGNPVTTTATSSSFSPGALTAKTYYRLNINSNGVIVNSAPVTVDVYPQLLILSLTPGQTINYSAVAQDLNATVTGGNGTFGYQWFYMLPGGSIWQPITTALTSSYSPGTLTQTTNYLFQVTSNGVTVNATTTVTVYPQLVSGSISPGSQSIVYNTVPSPMSVGGTTGGAGPGTYGYQWYSDASGSFQLVGTGSSYTPGPLTATTHFYVVTSSNGVSVASATVTVTVGPPPPPDLNYIRTRTVKKPGIFDKVTADGLTAVTDVEQSTTYFDGLGRSVQTVAKQASPLGYDLVVPQVYDVFGREAMHYLPYVSPSSDGNNKGNPLGEQNTFNTTQFPGEQFYYGRTDFEASPLNRPVANYAAGNSWVGNGKGVTMDYQVNTDADSVQIWNIALLQGGLPSNGGAYPTGQLFKTLTTDEQLHQVIEYKDKSGNVVLKKVQSWAIPAPGHSGWLCTYYVFDDLNNLRFVLPPKAVEWLLANSWSFGASGGNQMASELCFRYEYDQRQRMVVKQVPGAGEVDMVYDMRDRLVFTQDADQRKLGQWISTQYDALNRAIITGQMSYAVTRDVLQQSVTSQTTPGGSGTLTLPATLDLTLPDEQGLYQATQLITMDDGFTTAIDDAFEAFTVDAGNTVVNTGSGTAGLVVNNNPVPPGLTVDPLTINYYDNYDWVNGTGTGLGTSLSTAHTRDGNYFITTYNASPTYAAPVSSYPVATGQLTGTMHLVLGENRPLYAVSFYDDRSRLIQTQSINYTSGIDTVTNQYDFSGKPLRNLLTHYKAGNTAQYHTVLTKMDYDAAFRVKNIWKNIDGAASDQLISSLQYNELGQLTTRSLGNGLENVVNEYNVRGWLTGINKDYVQPNASGHYFGMELAYDKNTSVSSSPNYAHPAFNGNIAGMVWKSAGDMVDRKYDFTYDNVNRLTGADYTQQFAGGWGKSDPGGSGAAMDYSVTKLQYDANGNILYLNQNGFKIGAPTSPVDLLTYGYQTNSNKLLQVSDGANDPNTKLGDFHYAGTQQATGYTYDDNGNLSIDNNKGIDAIAYNYLNLPQQIHVNGKGTIRYTYDATGNKLQKVTLDDLSGLATTTLYTAGFQYQRQSPISNTGAGVDTLQFAGHEEGRARWAYHKYLGGQTGYGWEYDFYEKDHLGNTRVLLTQEKDTAHYVATMEAANRSTETALFFALDTSIVSRASVGYPNDTTMGAPNDSVTVLNGSGIKQGPAIILKVMSGDKVDLSVRYYYNSAGVTNSGSISPTDVLGSLAGGIFSIAGASHGALTDLSNPNTSPLIGALNGFINDPSVPDDQSKPKAYLNYVLLDNQLRYVADPNQSGALQVRVPGTVNGQLQLPLATGISIKNSGYLYIYLSNVTEHQDVFFDNLSVVHYSGPLLEETSYYPFGLTMAGISDKALKTQYAENKYRFQKQELQNKEFSDGSGLEMYEFKYRFDDPQLGRFWSVDPLADKYVYNSPYAFSENKVTGHIELEGLEAVPFSDPKQAVYAAGAAIAQAAANAVDKVSQKVEGSITFFKQLFSSGSTSISSENTTTAKASISFNTSNYLSYVQSNNTNSGAPSPANFDFSLTNSTALVLDTKIGTISTQDKVSTDDKGVQTNKLTASGNLMVSGFPITLSGSTSQSTNGDNTIGLKASTGFSDFSNFIIGTNYTSNTITGTKKVDVTAGADVKIGSKSGVKLSGSTTLSVGF